MALREFDDAHREPWLVWDTVPAATSGLAGNFRGGWLTFDNGRERRRLAPVPEGWATMADDRLGLLLRLAAPVPRPDAGAGRVAETRRLAGAPSGGVSPR